MVRKISKYLILLLLITGCSFPGLGKNVSENGIVIASGNTTERQILSEIVSQMIMHYIPSANTSLINNLGSTLLIVQSLEKEYANISGAMYTGTSLTGELGLASTTNPKEAMKGVVEGYANQYDSIWFPSYGFENTYAFMVTKDVADKYQLINVSDLEKVKDKIRVGVDNAWIKRQGDGYEQFKTIYGFELEHINSMEIGLVYNAVYANKMDVVLGYSTDGRIASYDLVLLVDDKKLFPPYETSPVVTKKILRIYPELETILLKLEGEINSGQMQELNRQSDDEHLEPYTVAKNFLEENNYFESKNVVPLIDRTLYKALIQDILPLVKEKQ